LLDEVRVAAVDVVGVLDLGDAVGDQSGEDQPCPRPDVGGQDRSAGEPLPAADDGVMAVDADVRAQPTNSLTNMNRPSYTFSVMRAVPVDTAASATAIGCRSVGKPG
jgi:hypothetical protein